MKSPYDADSQDLGLVLPHLLRKRRNETPDKEFLREVTGSSLTYAETHDLALRWATCLQRAGVGPGDRVAVMAPTSIDAAMALFASALLGAINVPLNTAYVGRLLEHAVNLTSPKVVLVAPDLVERFDAVTLTCDPAFFTTGATRHGSVPSVAAWADTEVRTEVASAINGRVAEWSETGTLLFTSGTTGPSKAVIMPWRQLYESAMTVWQGQLADDADVFYLPWPLNHISGVGPLYSMLVAGGTVVLREKWSTSSFMDDIYAFGCTHSTLMASMVRYVDELEVPTTRGPFPLKRVFLAPITERSKAMTKRLGIEYSTVFNQTEISAPIASVGYDPVPLGSCGRQRNGAQVRIVDPAGRDLPDGQRGELLVRTENPDAMNRGYWGMPEATEKSWEGGWFHTGDLLSRDEDGWFYYLGRIKEVIRVRGENVSATELEELVEEHPDVVEAAAVGAPSDVDDEEQIVLFVRMRTETTPGSAYLERFCTQRLPKFMVPSRILRVDDFPRTPTGKIRKDQLQDLVAAAVTEAPFS